VLERGQYQLNNASIELACGLATQVAPRRARGDSPYQNTAPACVSQNPSPSPGNGVGQSGYGRKNAAPVALKCFTNLRGENSIDSCMDEEFQMTNAAAPRVFISYSHESPEHRDRVLELADQLRADGIDAVIDQYIQDPPEGWPAWCAAQIDAAEFVLMVCTEIYFRRVSRKEEAGVGRGVLWEGRLIQQYLYDAGSISAKFIPVLLADGSDANVPLSVKGGTIYRVATPEGYECLFRLLSGQPLTPMPPLGTRKSLPPRKRATKGSAGEPSRAPASPPYSHIESAVIAREAEAPTVKDIPSPIRATRRAVAASGMTRIRHLVILIHGINTRALWFGTVAPSLEKAGLTVSAIGYGRFGILRFLLPIGAFRRAAANRVSKKIRGAIEIHKPRKVSVIAHSFGSYIVARILETEFDRHWDRIIVCGSVVREDFPLEQYLARFQPPILNEIGTRDVWPAIAAAVTWGYGSVGSHGFQSPAVSERWHSGFAHSDFLTPAFCTKFWVPFLRDGTVVEADPPSALPRWVNILTTLPLRWIISASLAVALSAPFLASFQALKLNMLENIVVMLENTVVRDVESRSPRSPPQPPSPKWDRLPSVSRLANVTNDNVPIFSDPDVGSEVFTRIRPFEFVSPDEQLLEHALVAGEAWYRFKLRGRPAYVPENRLEPR
jgi:hypothetical protein